MYACGIEGLAADAPANARHQLLCIKELAKAGGHESCQVPRSAPKPCPGTAKMVKAGAEPSQAATAAPKADPAADTAPVAATDPVAAAGADASGNSSEHQKSEAETNAEPLDEPVAPPRTVEEMAKRSLAASKKSMDDAGEAIKQSSDKAGSSVASAAKKTWDCVTSLFSDCK